MTTNDTPVPAIVAASTVRDVIVAAENNPDVKAAFIAQFGSQIAVAQKSPLVVIAAWLIAGAATRFGFQVDTATSTVLATVVAILAGDMSQWLSARMKALKS